MEERMGRVWQTAQFSAKTVAPEGVASAGPSFSAHPKKRRRRRRRRSAGIEESARRFCFMRVGSGEMWPLAVPALCEWVVSERTRNIVPPVVFSKGFIAPDAPS
jgi:hypothetical protein